MASFVIHNIAGERYLDLVEEKLNIKLTENERKEFLMANLIPDSSKMKKLNEDATKEARKKHKELIQQEKISTHFRSEEDYDLCIQSPIVESFEKKYSVQLSNSMSYLGYLFHLYTDSKFFEELFPNTFETLDENFKPTKYAASTKYMKVIKNGKLYTVEEFWDSKSDLSIYNDYTVMNKKLLEHYGYLFDIESFNEFITQFINPGIEEVDFSNILQVLKKTSVYIRQSYENQNTELNIFDEQKIIEFIENNALSFIEKYREIISRKNNKQYTKK